MKKYIPLLIIALFALSACSWLPAEPAAVEPEEINESSTATVEVSEEGEEKDSEEGVAETAEATLEIKEADTESEASEEDAEEDEASTEEVEEAEPIKYDQNAELTDVSGGTAKGQAGASFADGEYNLYASFEDLPALEDGFFYEGWVVRSSPLSVISTGETEVVNGNHTNNFTSTEDLTDHLLYVLTLEPDDGDPAPAAHILEGTFK